MIVVVVHVRVGKIDLQDPAFGIGDLGSAAWAFDQGNVLLIVLVPDHLGDLGPVAAAGAGGVQRSFHEGVSPS